MQRKHFLVTTILALAALSASPAQAQNRFFDDGTSGVGLTAGFISFEDATGFGAGISYTINSQFDLGLGFTKASFDEDEYGPDFSGTEFTPYFSVGVIRPKDTSIFGFDLNASYSTVSYSGDALDLLDWDMSANGYSIGGDAYVKLQGSPTLEIYPGLGIAYTSVTAKIEDSVGDSVEEDQSDAAISGRVSFLFNKKFVINPSFSTFDGNTTWAISIGGLFPTGTK